MLEKVRDLYHPTFIFFYIQADQAYQLVGGIGDADVFDSIPISTCSSRLVVVVVVVVVVVLKGFRGCWGRLEVESGILMLQYFQRKKV